MNTRTGNTLDINGKKLVEHQCPGCGHTWYADESTVQPDLRASSYPHVCPCCRRDMGLSAITADDGTIKRDMLTVDNLFCRFDADGSVMMENTSNTVCIGAKLGKVVRFGKPKRISKALIDALSCGDTTDDGDRVSDYFSIAERGSLSFSVSLIERKQGLEKGEKPFFSVHLIDDITGRDCDLQYTKKATQKELAELLREVQRNLVSELCSRDTLIVLAPGEKRTLRVGDGMTREELEALVSGELLAMELGREIMTEEYARKVFEWFSVKMFDGGKIEASNRENTLTASVFLNTAHAGTLADCSLCVSNTSDRYAVVDNSMYGDEELTALRGFRTRNCLYPHMSWEMGGIPLIPKVMELVENNGGLPVPPHIITDKYVGVDALEKMEI